MLDPEDAGTTSLPNVINFYQSTREKTRKLEPPVADI
jgi:hypothetical protein